LLAEATYVEGRDNPPRVHLTAHEAGETARRAGVGRLVVTHVPPWESWERAVADAAGAYDGPVIQASPGLVLEV
jgi:ribonuclease BN (tRNA processing enzyme)